MITASLGGCDAHRMCTDMVMDERRKHTVVCMSEPLRRGSNGQTVNPDSLCFLPTHSGRDGQINGTCIHQLLKKVTSQFIV